MNNVWLFKKIIDKTETPFEYYLKEGRTTVVLKIKDIEFIDWLQGQNVPAIERMLEDLSWRE